MLWHAADGVATITLNRPERMNAWTWPMQAAFFELVDRADDDPDVRAVVLTGSGRGFCPGMDMEWLSAVSKTAGDDTERRPITALADLRKPLIAAINGACAGIGLVLALLSDVRFAAAGARISTSFTRRGFRPSSPRRGSSRDSWAPATRWISCCRGVSSTPKRRSSWVS